MSGVPCVHVSRTDRVDPDLVLAEFACHAASHLEHGGLGGVVRQTGYVLWNIVGKFKIHIDKMNESKYGHVL